jgi:hypothetical protein
MAHVLQRTPAAGQQQQPAACCNPAINKQGKRQNGNNKGVHNLQTKASNTHTAKPSKAGKDQNMAMQDS